MLSAASVVDRLTREGLVSLLDAAKANGIRHISIFALHRACMSGALESIKVAGKRLTSVEAFKRWVVERSQLPERRHRGRGRGKPSRTSEAARAFLQSKGLNVGGAADA